MFYLFTEKRVGPHSKKYFGGNRERVIKRDHYECQFCRRKRKLVVHHKDENRDNHRMNNLITLCKSCHAKLHHPIQDKTRVRKMSLLRRKGLTYQEIGDKYEISRQRAHQILHK